MPLSDVNKNVLIFPHSGSVRCLPAPNIFPLAKETFAKGKMFWNVKYAKLNLFNDNFGEFAVKIF